MAMPSATPARGEWTVEDLWRLPEDGNRYEVVDGVLLVTPSPAYRHQEAVLLLARRLADHTDRIGMAWTAVAPADVVFDRRSLVQPDALVAPLVDGRRPAAPSDVRHLLLAVEVLSPATAHRDRGLKRRLYQQHADEYWVVDLDARIIERWRPGDARPEVLDNTLTWKPPGADEALELDLAAFFGSVWDE